MKRVGWLFVCLGVLLGLMGAARAQLAWDPKEFMGLNEITPGMEGYGKTVYQGTKVETFDIEVIGVLRKVDFGFDMILIRVLNGPVVDRKLQSVSGMSGSPIYIDDRLIGAYAYSWDFQNEAIAGVTPIANMLEATQPGAASPSLLGSLVPKSKVLKIADKLITRVNVAASPRDAQAMQAKADPTTMVLSPVSTPVFVSGMHDKAMAPLQKVFDRYNMRALPGPGEMDGPAPALEAGSAVAVSLMEGDVNLSAVGTVTYVKGDTVLAFGHPFLGMGKLDLPMSTAYVHGILSSSMSSFKLASPMGRVGRIFSDRASAIAGKVGELSDTFPVRLFIRDKARNLDHRYSVDVVTHPELTPPLLFLYALYGGVAQAADLFNDEGTFTARMITETDKLGKLDQTLVMSPRINTGFGMPFAEFYLLPDMLLSNPYEPVKIKSVMFDIDYQAGRNYAIIEKMVADRPVARPGETVNLAVKVRPYGKPVETHNLAVQVPMNTTEPAMLVAVAGGALWPLLRTLDEVPPKPEDGVKGLADWMTASSSSQTMITAKLLPSPSYAYRGRMLRDIPPTLLDVLRFAEASAVMPMQPTGEQGEASAMAGENMLPTAYFSQQTVPYALTGLQVAAIAIESDDRMVQPDREKSGFDLQMPVLSSALGVGEEASDMASEDESPDGDFAMQLLRRWQTPQQQARFMTLRTAVNPTPMPVARPRLRLPHALARPLGELLPLSQAFRAWARPRAELTIEGVDEPSTDEGVGSDDGAADDDAVADDEGGDDEMTSDDGETVYASLKGVLTKKQMSWGLNGRDAFLQGKHLGTGVTSRGNLELTPSVRTVFSSTEMVPWRLVTAGGNTYVAGWGSNTVVRLAPDGTNVVCYTRKDAKAITALAADAAGNLLVASWPDAHVTLVKPDGTVADEWSLAGYNIWALAVSSTGVRYAACDQGTLLILRDDKQNRLQAACTVPDKHITSLLADADGNVLLATAPRGKVYSFSNAGRLTSRFEGRGAVSSLALDAAGNLYVGTSPTCRIVRVSPDGLQKVIMRGMGQGNLHVLAMKMVGNDLYATTGPAGGIYRIAQPAGDAPDVMPIFAREDLRTGQAEEEAIGPESVMVNDLAVNARGEVLAAASTPGQVLKLIPRQAGTFLSTVLQTPVVTQWGRIDLQADVEEGQSLVVETRSGFTAVPDKTWSAWEPVSTDWDELGSPAATYVQFRARLAGEASPRLTYARVFYQPANQAPVVKLMAPQTGVYWSGTQSISWEATDPNGDALTYTVFTSADRGKTWRQLVKLDDEDEDEAGDDAAPAPSPDDNPPPATGKKNEALLPNGQTTIAAVPTHAVAPVAATPRADAKPAAKVEDKKGEQPKDAKPDEPTRETPAAPEKAKKLTDGEMKETDIPWDTKTTADGRYLIRVVATDKYAKPNDPKTVEVLSGLITVDNTAPTVTLSDKIYGWDAVKQFVVTDNIGPILGGKYRIDDGPWTALVPADGMFNRRQESVKLIAPTGEIELTKGEYKLRLQVQDAAGNMLDKTITVIVGQQPPQEAAPVVALPVEMINGADELTLLDFLLNGLQQQ